MYKLQIRDDEGRTTPVPLLRDEVTVGRKEGNTIRLTERNVSRRHARIVKQNGKVVVDDLSRYGTRINGERISGPTELGSGDVIQIGDYHLTLDVDEAAAAEKRAASAPKAREDATSVVHVGRGLSQRGPGKPRLVAVTTNLAGTEYELGGDDVVVGRTDDSDLVVDHRSISRRHARIHKDDDGNWAVEDLGSANGIRVNGEEYEKTALRKGDVLELGHVELRWVAPGEVFAYEPGLEGAAAGGGSSKGLLVLVALILVAGGAWFAWQQYFSKPLDETRVGQAEPEEVAPAEGDPAEGAAGAPAAAGTEEGVDVDALVAKAEAAVEAERWDDGIAAWNGVLAADADHEVARQGLESARAEKETAALLERLSGLVEAGKIDEAWTDVGALSSVPEASAYRARAVELNETITAAYLGNLLDRAEEALEAERWDEAASLAGDILELDADHEGARTVAKAAERGAQEAEQAAAAAARKAAARKARPTPRKAAPEPRPVKAEPAPEQASAKSGKELYREARRLHSKDPTQALVLYKQATSKGYVRAWRQMGSIYIQQGNQAAAIKAYKKYLSLNPGAADAEVIRNTIVRIGGQP